MLYLKKPRLLLACLISDVHDIVIPTEASIDGGLDTW